MISIDLPAPQSPPIPAFDRQYALDGTTYTLRFRWYDTDAGWRIVTLDEPGQVILAGAVRMAVDFPLYLSRVPRVPPGYLLLIDTTGQGQEAGLADLGGRHLLYYIPAAANP